MNRRLLPLVALLLSFLLTAPAIGQEALWQAFLDSARNAAAKGDYDEAEKFLAKADKEAEDFPPNDKRRCSSWLTRATFEERRFRYDVVEAQFKKCVALGAKIKDESYYAFLQTQLANHYRMRGKYEIAEPLYKKALVIRERVNGPNHWETAVLIREFADNYRDAGKYDESELLYKRSIKILELDRTKQAFIQNQKGNSLACLGELYLRQKKFAESEALCLRTAQIFEKSTTVPSQFNSASCHGTLGEARRQQKKLDEAKESFDKAIAFIEDGKVVSIRMHSVFSNAAKLAAEQRRTEDEKMLNDEAKSIMDGHNKGAGQK